MKNTPATDTQTERAAELQRLNGFIQGMTENSRGCVNHATEEVVEMLEDMGFRTTRMEPLTKLYNAIATYLMEAEELIWANSGNATLTSR